MIKLRFLAPVLALAACALPAGASVVSYCDGYGCGSNTMAAFTTLTSSDTYASASPITFSNSLGVLSGNQYTDDLTNVIFQATHNLADPGVLDTQYGAGDVLTITIPATYTVVLLSLTSQNGAAGFYLDGSNYTNFSSTPTSVGYINSSPTGPWTIQISPFASGFSVAVNSFDAVGAAPSPTPEVGTMLLIGSGLIAMRWVGRFFRSPQSA